jgi:hypothetical protein
MSILSPHDLSTSGGAIRESESLIGGLPGPMSYHRERPSDNKRRHTVVFATLGRVLGAGRGGESHRGSLNHSGFG